jgi:hypothetical protein
MLDQMGERSLRFLITAPMAEPSRSQLPPEPRRELRDFLYWPSRKEYSVPWILGPAVFFVLTAFGAAGGKPPSLGSPPPPTFIGLLLLGLLLLGFNAMLLWAHLRSQFLTWKIAREPFLGTLAALVSFYLAAWAVILLWRGEAKIAIDTTLDPIFTLQCLDLGLTGMVPALLLSALLKSEEPGFTNILIERDNALRLLRRLAEGTLEPGEHRALSRALDQLRASAEPLLGRVRTRRELLLLKAWDQGAGQLADHIRGLGYHELMSARTRMQAQLTEAMAKLDDRGNQERVP